MINATVSRLRAIFTSFMSIDGGGWVIVSTSKNGLKQQPPYDTRKIFYAHNIQPKNKVTDFQQKQHAKPTVSKSQILTTKQ
jgi:hypothetical protein